MSAQNIQIIQDFYERLQQRGHESAFGLLAPDFVLHQAESLPYAGVYRGVEGVKKFFSVFFQIWQTFHSDKIEYFSLDDERVLALSQVRATAKTGHQIDMPMAQVFSVRNGRILEARPFYWDTAEVKRATTQETDDASA